MATSKDDAVSGNSRPDFPLGEWDRAPWNRWTFQHVAEILSTAPVRHSPGKIVPLKAAPYPLTSLTFIDQGSPTSIGNWLADSYTDGFIVVAQNQVVFEDYFNGMTPSTLHLAQSVTKSITGTACGILISRGLIDPDKQLMTYLPELEKTAFSQATVRHILDMTSGVRFDENYTDPYSDVGKIDIASGWKEPTLPGHWPANMRELILELQTLIRPHGEKFEYRSIETDVLALIMEKVTGKSLADIVSDYIWKPIGAEADACFTIDRSGFALGDGGFNACLRDYARFGLLWANNGKVGGEQIVSEDWIASTLSGNAEHFKAPYTDILPEGAYRNQFWLPKAQGKTLLCRGVFGQMIYIDIEKSFVAVKVSSWPVFTNPSEMKTAINAMEHLAAHFS